MGSAVTAGSVRAAGIDCGTNTIRLLVGDVDRATGRVADVERTLRIVRLGQGVDATGRLAPEALARTFAAVEEYAAICRGLGVGPEAIRMVATSATRDASNREEFVAGVRDRLGVAPEVVDGLEEAALSFEGALTSVSGPAPYLVVDLGGGSTELVLGAGAPEAACSMDVGCVRMAERHLRADPPGADELARAAVDIDAALDAAERSVDLSRTRTLVGVAGTVTSLAAHALGLTEYNADAIDGTVLPVATVLESCQAMWTMTLAERLALGFLAPGRADVMPGGALVFARVVERVAARVAGAGAGAALEAVLVSEHDILDGVALSAARRAG
jgi:exopolyphosphatase/guanosine-5'-triphosphate,3'-diphosphate pyrophosphatase